MVMCSQRSTQRNGEFRLPGCIAWPIVLEVLSGGAYIDAIPPPLRCGRPWQLALCVSYVMLGWVVLDLFHTVRTNGGSTAEPRHLHLQLCEEESKDKKKSASRHLPYLNRHVQSRERTNRNVGLRLGLGLGLATL
ncbi:unnamed protein product [Discosporangium mesarthrocarpum]